jgi:hypothetical protein
MMTITAMMVTVVEAATLVVTTAKPDEATVIMAGKVMDEESTKVHHADANQITEEECIGKTLVTGIPKGAPVPAAPMVTNTSAAVRASMVMAVVTSMGRGATMVVDMVRRWGVAQIGVSVHQEPTASRWDAAPSMIAAVPQVAMAPTMVAMAVSLA